jgi:hypothetical protein
VGLIVLFLNFLSLPPVFILNHASPDDFQPLSLREMHTELAANFQGAKVNVAGKCVYGNTCAHLDAIMFNKFLPKCVHALKGLGGNTTNKHMLKMM